MAALAAAAATVLQVLGSSAELRASLTPLPLPPPPTLLPAAAPVARLLGSRLWLPANPLEFELCLPNITLSSSCTACSSGSSGSSGARRAGALRTCAFMHKDEQLQRTVDKYVAAINAHDIGALCAVLAPKVGCAVRAHTQLARRCQCGTAVLDTSCKGGSLPLRLAGLCS